ncbi:MAG: hypothetical protein FJ291_33570 [Planctomycetes bacterium]|nr:hypothetical protein [Planctomycetota bacterium]
MAEPRVDVVCEGGPREMGVAQGAALRERIAGARDALRQLDAVRKQRPWWMPWGVFFGLAERKAEGMLGKALARHSPEMAQRLAGMAEGAGVSQGALCLLNAAEVLLSSVRDVTTVPPAAACSAVAVRGSRSATGEPVIAHNFDYLPVVQPFYILRESRPSSGLRSLDFTVAPMCGTIDGMNERGLCVVMNYAFPVDSGPAGVPNSMVIAEALARCGTVAEAADWVLSRPRWGGGLLMLADAEGDLASVELSNTRSAVRHPAEGEDLLFHANQYSTPSMREVEAARDAVFTAKAPDALVGCRLHESSEKRAARLAELLPQMNRLGPDELARVMSDHGPAGAPDAATVCMHSDYWQTTACLQWLPRSRRLRASYGTACAAAFREFT